MEFKLFKFENLHYEVLYTVLLSYLGLLKHGLITYYVLETYLQTEACVLCSLNSFVERECIIHNK